MDFWLINVALMFRCCLCGDEGLNNLSTLFLCIKIYKKPYF